MATLISIKFAREDLKIKTLKSSIKHKMIKAETLKITSNNSKDHTTKSTKLR